MSPSVLFVSQVMFVVTSWVSESKLEKVSHQIPPTSA